MSSAPAPHPVTEPRRARERWLLLIIAAAVFVGQLLPHPPNVTPIRAAALFGGARLGSRSAALAVTLGSYFASSLAVALATGNWSYGFHALAPVVYASFALSVALGRALRARRGVVAIAAATVAGSLLFYGLTNLAVWWWLDGYPKTPAGLLACYVAGLPHLASGLLGDGAWALLFFGGLTLSERAPTLRQRARGPSSS